MERPGDWMEARCDSVGVVALLLLTPVVGRVWLGWGYIADNEKILDSLPVPPGAQRISVRSHSYSSEELIFIPPDGWGTLATYQAPAEASKDDIVDFYSSRLSPEWRYCVTYVNTFDLLTRETGVVMTGVSFTRGLSLVPHRHPKHDNGRPTQLRHIRGPRKGF